MVWIRILGRQKGNRPGLEGDGQHCSATFSVCDLTLTIYKTEHHFLVCLRRLL